MHESLSIILQTFLFCIVTHFQVEWDTCLHGTSNGVVFGEEKFVCAAGHGSFTPKEVLYLEPSTEEDPLFEAMSRTLMQVEIELAQEDPERTADMRRLKVLVTFWAGVVHGFHEALSRLKEIYGTAALYESQGAADGRYAKRGGKRACVVSLLLLCEVASPP